MYLLDDFSALQNLLCCEPIFVGSCCAFLQLCCLGKDNHVPLVWIKSKSVWISLKTPSFSGFFVPVFVFRPAVRQHTSFGFVYRKSVGRKEIFMKKVGEFVSFRSVLTADHPCVWQRRDRPLYSDARTASLRPLRPGSAEFHSNPFPLSEGRRTQASLVLQPIPIGRVRRCRSPSTGPQRPIRHSC